MSFHVSPHYARDSRQLLIVVLLSCFLPAQSDEWHMPDMYHSKVEVATTTACEVCGTVVPPVIVPGHVATTTPVPVTPAVVPVTPAATTIPAPPLAPSRYMITTTTPAADPYQHGPVLPTSGSGEVSTTWPMKKTGVIAGVATGSAIALGGLIAGIVTIVQKNAEHSSTTQGAFMAPTTTSAAYALPTTVSYFSVATVAPNRTLDKKATAHHSVAQAGSAIQSKYSSDQIAKQIGTKASERGVTTFLVAGCIVFAAVILAVGFGMYVIGSYSRRTRTLYLQAENGGGLLTGDEPVSDMSGDDGVE